MPNQILSHSSATKQNLPDHVVGTRAALFYLWGAKGRPTARPPSMPDMPKIKATPTTAQMSAHLIQSDSFEFWD